MGKSVELKTEKITLRPFEFSDASKMVTKLCNDPYNKNYISWYVYQIDDGCETVDLEHHFSIIDISKNRVIGQCGFTSIDRTNYLAEIGILIKNKNYWNNGFIEDALSLLLKYGFNALELHNVFVKFCCPSENMIKTCEKLGFKKIGVRRESYRKNKDILLMDLLVNEFNKK